MVFVFPLGIGSNSHQERSRSAHGRVSSDLLPQRVYLAVVALARRLDGRDGDVVAPSRNGIFTEIADRPAELADRELPRTVRR